MPLQVLLNTVWWRCVFSVVGEAPATAREARALPGFADRNALRRGSEAKHVIDRVGEIVDARYRDNDDVAMTLAVLGNPKEFAAPVFAQIDRKKFSFDLQLSCFDDAIHGRRREC